MRITENMMTAMYNRNLQRNVANLASSNLKLTSQRQYNHVSEDPAAAAKAFTVRDQIATYQHREKCGGRAGYCGFQYCND